MRSLILAAGKPHGQPSSGRKKDRISYAQAPFRIDLTQVKSLDPVRCRVLFRADGLA